MNEIDRKSRELLPGQEPISVKRRHGGLRSEPPSVANAENQRFMVAAARGEVATLRRMLTRDANFLTYKDENDWQPLHEAIRGGNLETVRYLVESGADIGSTVAGGGNAVWVAKQTLPANHEVTKYLLDIGIPDASEEE